MTYRWIRNGMEKTGLSQLLYQQEPENLWMHIA